MFRTLNYEEDYITCINTLSNDIHTNVRSYSCKVININPSPNGLVYTIYVPNNADSTRNSGSSFLVDEEGNLLGYEPSYKGQLSPLIFRPSEKFVPNEIVKIYNFKFNEITCNAFIDAINPTYYSERVAITFLIPSNETYYFNMHDRKFSGYGKDLAFRKLT